MTIDLTKIDRPFGELDRETKGAAGMPDPPLYGYRLIWKVGKYKDCPAVMRPALERLEGALPYVRYENGKFYKIIWVRLDLVWPEEVRIALDADDALVLCKDWGVKALIGGGLLTRPGKE